MNINNYTIKCEGCGKIKHYSSCAGYYEAIRLNRTRCRSCSAKHKWNLQLIRSKYDNLIKFGDRHGLLTVISEHVEPGCRVRCKCKCGKIISRRVHRLLSGKFLGCKSCLVENLSLNWKGIGKVPKMAFIKIKHRAQEKHKEFSVTLEYISELFDLQDGRCALTGQPLTFYVDGIPNQTASLDRIDSDRGYVAGNVQWVHKDINFMKQSFTNKYFIKLCELVVTYDKNRNTQ